MRNCQDRVLAYINMNTTRHTELVHSGKYLELVREGTWEFVRRKNTSGIVAVVAITDDRELILVEQMRVPIGRPTIEFPAGLAGDIVGQEDESLETAARRELLEETGYEATHFKAVAFGPTSAGLTDETVTTFLASGLRKTGVGGGDESENIKVHLVLATNIDQWFAAQQEQGKAIETRVFAGLYLMNQSKLLSG